MVSALLSHRATEPSWGALLAWDSCEVGSQMPSELQLSTAGLELEDLLQWG